MQVPKTSHSASWITKVILASLVFLSALTYFVDRPSPGEPYRPAKELATSAAKGQKLAIAFRWSNQVLPEAYRCCNCTFSIIEATRLVETRLRTIQTGLRNRIIPPGFNPLQFSRDYPQELPAHP